MRLTGRRDINNSFYCHKAGRFNSVEKSLASCIVFCGNLIFMTIHMQWQSCCKAAQQRMLFFIKVS